MDLFDALQIIFDLARQNVCDEQEMPEEYTRQMEALEIVEAFCNTLT